MDYRYTLKYNELTLKAQDEQHLVQISALLDSETSLEGTLWLARELKVDSGWDLNFWLKRCESGCVAFEYDMDRDEKFLLPLVYSTSDKKSQSPCPLPITYTGSKSAFFLDRDGIVNTDQAYVYKSEDVEFVAGIVEFIQFLQTRYDYVIVLTNQSGVGRGYYEEKDVNILHDWMRDDLEKSEARINAWYYCPYHPKGEVEKYHRDSYLRKPNAGMALQAARDYDLDLSRCAMVGDKDSDYLKDLQLETFLLKGNYPLKLNLPQFQSLDELRNFLETRE